MSAELRGLFMPKQSFMRGAIVLTTASIITKILGMMIQVVIARELGAAGFGLFRTVNPIFYMLLTISTLALPPALAKVIAENMAMGNMAKIRRALKIANTTVLILSTTVCIAALILAPISTKWLDPRATLPFYGALLRIPLVCLSSIMSGFYIGTQDQTPPAIAWIIETVVRTVITIPLILKMNPYGIAFGALAVMIGAGIGELAGYLYMLRRYVKRDILVIQLPPGKTNEPGLTRKTVKDLVEVALPTTVHNVCGIIAYAAEPVIIYAAFAKVGVAKMMATSLYGSFGMAIQLLLLPTVLSSSLSSVVIPAVSEAAAMRNARLVSHRLNQVIQITFLIALPATVFLMLSGHDLAITLYKDTLAGSLLIYIAPLCAFIYIRDPLSALLQGLNKATLSAAISLTTSGVRMYAIYYFISHTQDGIFGVAKATAIAAVLSTMLSFYFVRKFVSLSIDFTKLAKMIIATGLATIPIHQVHALLPETWPSLHILGSVITGCIVYTLALVYLKVLPVKTVERIPWIGHIMAELLQRMPFVS
jgi:stage V sporulation protein B